MTRTPLEVGLQFTIYSVALVYRHKRGTVVAVAQQVNHSGPDDLPPEDLKFKAQCQTRREWEPEKLGPLADWEFVCWHAASLTFRVEERK